MSLNNWRTSVKKNFWQAFAPVARKGITTVTERRYSNESRTVDVHTEILIPNVPILRYLLVQVLIAWTELWQLSGDFQGVDGDIFPYCHTRTHTLFRQIAVMDIYLTVNKIFELPFKDDAFHRLLNMQPYFQNGKSGNAYTERTCTWEQ